MSLKSLLLRYRGASLHGQDQYRLASLAHLRTRPHGPAGSCWNSEILRPHRLWHLARLMTLSDQRQCGEFRPVTTSSPHLCKEKSLHHPYASRAHQSPFWTAYPLGSIRRTTRVLVHQKMSGQRYPLCVHHQPPVSTRAPGQNSVPTLPEALCRLVQSQPKLPPSGSSETCRPMRA